MTKQSKNVVDKERRNLLKIFSSAGISQGLLRASPLVGGMMMSRLADAQETRPNKSVIIFVPSGALPEHWYPDVELNNFPEMSAAYAPVKSECNFLRNMSHSSGGHGRMGTVINTAHTGDSFDVNMGRTIGANRPFRYVNLGVFGSGHGDMTREAGTAVPTEDNPFNAFNRLFGAVPSSDKALARKLNIIDTHKEALGTLTGKLGAYEKHRLDQHLTSIEETEQRLNEFADGSLAVCENTAPTPFPLTNDTFKQQAELQADIITLALQCNLTASCSLSIGNQQAEFSFKDLNFKGLYHNSIHAGNDGDPTYPHFRETRAHLSSMSSYFIESLMNAGLLDSTIVCEVSDMGNGDSHSRTDIPLIMAGGGGVIQRGVSNAGSENYTQLNMLHTAAVALNADQHPDFKRYATDVIPGVLT